MANFTFIIRNGLLYARVDGKDRKLGRTLAVDEVVDRGDGESAVVLKFDGLHGERSVEIDAATAQDTFGLRAALAKHGYVVPRSRLGRQWLATYVASQLEAAPKAFRPKRAGWHLRSAIWRYFHGDEGNPHAVGGDVESWNREIGQYLPGNPYLLFAASAGFAAVLMRHLVPNGSFILHFMGKPRTSKTTALRVGGSVWRCSDQMRTWNFTSNALLEYARQHGDSLCVLDELGEGKPGERGGPVC